MRAYVPRVRRNLGVLIGVAGLALSTAAPVSAADFPLREALNGRMTGDFGVVSVVENGLGGLDFTVTLNPETLGERADLYRLYFNLSGTPTGMSGMTEDSFHTSYEILTNPAVTAGAGADFGFGVEFGSGAGKKGNGVLQQATFSLHADPGLSLDALTVEESKTAKGHGFHVAVHVQGSEISSVGGVMETEPEPPVEPPSDETPPGSDEDPCDGGIFTCQPRDP